MVIRNSGAAIFISSLDNDKRLYLKHNYAVILALPIKTTRTYLDHTVRLRCYLLFSPTLTSSLKSQHKGLKNCRISFVFRNLKTDGSYASSDVGSDLKVVYVESQPSGVVDELIVP
uniref:Uncharacterized protein n=1 Tax=Loa loa TaxID=7209 RepID=A0A1I7VZS9_LOALO